MNTDQLRHWLAMHCPNKDAWAIFNDVSEYRQGKGLGMELKDNNQ